MKLGIHFSDLSLPGGPGSLAPILAATARAAEDGGCSTFTMMDHWFQMEQLGGAHGPMLEGYTSMGFLAGQTRRLTLGRLVTGVTYRHPGLLAKIVATLDILSGGRAQLGIGAAWYEREHQGLGVQSVCPGTGGGGTQARRAGSPLRSRRPRPRRHREDHHHGRRPACRRRRLPRRHGGVRQARHRAGLGEPGGPDPAAWVARVTERVVPKLGELGTS